MSGRVRINIVKITIIVVTIQILGCAGGVKDNRETLKVFAASSLTDVLNELVDSFQVKNDFDIQINAASSGTLARQIVQGANPDLFISANKCWADYIDSMGFFQEELKTEVARNKLVLVSPKASEHEGFLLNHLLDTAVFKNNDRISIGNPAHVPAGKYAKQALQYFDLYDVLEPKILPAKDVRSALLIVELGECPFGIVYQTDLTRSEKVSFLATFSEESHDPITYIAGVCNLNSGSKLFFSYLQTEQAKSIWFKHGFQ